MILFMGRASVVPVKGSSPRIQATIRAKSCQGTITFLDTYRPGSRAAFEKHVPPGYVDEVFSYGSAGWIPLEVDCWIGRGIIKVLGVEEMKRLMVRYSTQHLDSPLLAGLVKTSISLLGPGPGSLIKWMPKAMPLVFRDAFRIIIEELGPSRARVRYDVLSDVFLNEPGYPVVIECAIRSIFAFTKATGDVKVTRDLERRTYTVEAEWR
jgi:hypothetical protein